MRPKKIFFYDDSPPYNFNLNRARSNGISVLRESEPDLSEIIGWGPASMVGFTRSMIYADANGSECPEPSVLGTASALTKMAFVQYVRYRKLAKEIQDRMLEGYQISRSIRERFFKFTLDQYLFSSQCQWIAQALFSYLSINTRMATRTEDFEGKTDFVVNGFNRNSINVDLTVSYNRQGLDRKITALSRLSHPVALCVMPTSYDTDVRLVLDGLILGEFMPWNLYPNLDPMFIKQTDFDIGRFLTQGITNFPTTFVDGYRTHIQAAVTEIANQTEIVLVRHSGRFSTPVRQSTADLIDLLRTKNQRY